jgi:hypothetical protein
MLDLPDGNILFSSYSNQLYAYTPGGSQLASGAPTVSSISLNSNGSYTLAGTQLNGISEGAAYGDDAQMASNYPIVRLTDASGNAYYCKTTNWSSVGVMTGTTPETTNFTLPSGLAGGAYSLQVIANGIASKVFDFSTTAAYQFEVENLTVNAASQTVSPQTDPNLSNGQGGQLQAVGVGDYVTYQTPTIAAGNYAISVGVKEWTPRGQFQMSGSRADQSTWSNIGPVLDMYNSVVDYTNLSVGSWAPGSTNAKLFKFLVTGKNSASTGYSLFLDYIRLTPQ